MSESAGQGPSSPSFANTPVTAEKRLSLLRQEASTATDPRAQALLHFELARLLDTHFGNDAAAAREHLHAAHVAPDFHAPLHALIRIFGRRGSSRNLAKLYDALRKTAESDSDRISAGYELANLHERDRISALKRISVQAPYFEPALLSLELAERQGGRPLDAWRATMQRVELMSPSPWREAIATDAATEGARLAAEAIGRGELETAQEILQKLTTPNNAVLLRLRLEVHARAGEWNDVVKTVHELLPHTELESERALLWFFVAEAALAKDDANGAGHALAESLVEANESASLLSLYSKTNLDKAAAARAWVTALAAAPKTDVELHGYVGRIAFEAGLYDEARDAYEIAVSQAEGPLRTALAGPYAQVLESLIDRGDHAKGNESGRDLDALLSHFDEATGALTDTGAPIGNNLLPTSVKTALADAEADGDAAKWEWVRTIAEREGDAEARVRACEELAKRVEPRFVVPLLEEAGSCAWFVLKDEARSEAILRQCVDLAPERKSAFRLLEQVLASKGSTLDALALIDNRIASTDDPDELARLYYDRARMLRTEGDLDGVLSALENALLLDSEHLGALALQAETQVAKKDWHGAVAALRELANAPAPIAQRRLALLGAIDLLDGRLDDPEEALKVIEGARGELAEDTAIIAKRVSLVARLGENIAELTAPSLAPEDEELYAIAGTDEVRTKLASMTVEKIAADVARTLPLNEGKLRELLRWAERAENAAWIRTACCALRAMGKANATERTRAAIAPARADATQEVSALTLERLWNAGADSAAAAPSRLLAFARPLTRRVGARPMSQSGSRSLRTVGDSERTEFEAICAVFGTRFDELLPGLDPEAVHVCRTDGRVVCELGIALRSPFSSKIRFAVGRLAFAQRYGVGPVLELDPEIAVTEMMRTARALGFAPAESIEVSLSEGDEITVREGLDGFAVSSITREACAEALRELREAATRAGVWASGDVQPAFDLARIDPSSVSSEPAWLDTDDLEAAVRFWISGWPAATRFGGGT